jgi:hypothetical protein
MEDLEDLEEEESEPAIYAREEEWVENLNWSRAVQTLR